MKHLSTIFCLALMAGLFAFKPVEALTEGRPNILFIIADDWSYPHAGIYGDPAVKTPHFDRIAREGVLFDHAYVASPSCTPSRAAILTGQYIWRLGEGANLYGPLPAKHLVYPDLLEDAGYQVGFTQKGWAPGAHEGRLRNPAGDRYDTFSAFLQAREGNTPFCFWFGSGNPHRGYQADAGKKAGIDPALIRLPACLPESQAVREDMADYYAEVQDFDAEIGILLAKLDSIGELDQTLIVVTSDNGMPFPRGKGTLYDLGTRVPLAMRWGNKRSQKESVPHFVSLTDLAPTFLEAAGLAKPDGMTGKSIMPYLAHKKMPRDRDRDQVFLGRERHVPGQEAGDWGGYPSRAIRTEDYLYIHNFRPNRWPAGTPDYQQASFYPAYYSDVDGGPTKRYMIDHREVDQTLAERFSLAFDKRPREELYDLKQDPDQLHNVAGEKSYAKIKKRLNRQLFKTLLRSKDPRLKGGANIFESYPYTGGAPFPRQFKRSSPRYATVKIDSFPSDYVSARSVEVLVPVNVHHDETFPVLYMFDGQNLFHPFKGWGGEENQGWQVDAVLDSLNQAGTVPKMIVVGIFNSPDRMSEYMPAKPAELLKQRIAETKHDWYKAFKTNPPRSDQQLQFIVEELKPYIDSQFKTKTAREHTFVAGSSMGGLISAYAICEYPEVFGGAACVSTHWPPLDGVFLEYLKQHLPDPATHRIYFDYGTEGLDGEYESYQKIADRAMEARGYQAGKNWMSLKFEGARHYEDDWRARLHIPLEFLTGKQK